MKSTFDKLVNRQRSDSEKWNYYDADVLPLWVADMDFPSPKFILDDLQTRVGHGIFGYSKVQNETKESVQIWLAKRHDWHVEPEEILILPGVVPSFNVAAKAVTKPGDSIIFQTPAYHPFFNVSTNSGTIEIVNPLLSDKDGYFYISDMNFLEAITPKTRLFLLCNPQNPTGRVFSKTELSIIADHCIENNIIICSDEIHSDIVYSGNKHIPIASLSQEVSNNTITLMSASKTFNIAGLKSSFAIIKNPVLRELFQSASNGSLGSINLLGETALRSALNYGEDWLLELLNYLEENRNYLVDYVNQDLPGIRIKSPEGTYLGWLDCREACLEDPADFFLTKAKVAMNSGSWFGSDYKQFVRINFGCPLETLQKGLDRIKGSLQNR